MTIPDEGQVERSRGCLSVSAATDFNADPTILSLIKSEFPRSLDSRAASRYLVSTLRGLRVGASGGASQEALRDIATMALRALIVPRHRDYDSLTG